MSRGAYLTKGHRKAPTTFGERLKAIRMSFGWSQKALSRHLGVAQQSISNWEKDIVPPIGAARNQVARILGIEWEALETGAGFCVPDSPPVGNLAEGSLMAIDDSTKKPLVLPRVEPGEGLLVEAGSGQSTPLDPSAVLAEIQAALKAGGSVWVVVKRPAKKPRLRKKA